MVLYIIQGPPGSGKSYVANMLANGLQSCFMKVIICSTDDFFMVDGVYKFDPSKLPEYHRKNLEKAIEHMRLGYNVIVDNTNVQRWQCREYVRFAVENNIPVNFIRVTGDWGNSHGVPSESVEKMESQMEDLTVESVLMAKAPWEK